MKKIIIPLIALSLLFFLTCATKDDQRKFYQPLPYDGMNIPVNSITERLYKINHEDTTTPQTRELASVEIKKYNKDGLLIELELKGYDEEKLILNFRSINEYEKNDLKKTIKTTMHDGEPHTSTQEYSKHRNDFTSYISKSDGKKEFYTAIHYDYKEQTATNQSKAKALNP